ncbi:hypothetical protein D0869_14048 [Hortaea werneckii]|uniref:Uncharacterized protein n=1 Tax=Hortaea werneckii TaxID=91943 RepID=A0A3M6Z0L1_HORWE|nr:hypothetical protein KC334_g3209 [Hortaea werneckii]KAI7017849.1 hypothetical protein KC355_g3535 [Hortaea werneckii]KAI7175636.1 hypothetical protein KC324_g10017 [Hortaea werneckii]KAI7585011.1 hypothetical protein KC316_g6381 [Hortaea werneckii]KAI7672187.1 hypothetical protein KC318_g3026 [Hortaea werneckii]
MAEIADLFLDAINITVSGACGPLRESPIQCYFPTHQSYADEAKPRNSPPPNAPTCAIPGGVPRIVKSVLAKDGSAIVFDRDVVTTWRLPSPMAATDDCHDQVLKDFAEFLANLGMQTVTIGLAALEDDMMEDYYQMGQGLTPFSCSPHERTFLRDFLATRECFAFAENGFPRVQVTFFPTLEDDQLAVEIRFTAALPSVQFQDLRNVIGEGERFLLKPTLDVPPSSSTTTIDFFLGPIEEEWLSWSDSLQAFCGTVPQRRAAYCGAGRLDAYTIPLELKVVITRLFAADIRFEQVIRVALPLTVRRQPDRCGRIEMPPHSSLSQWAALQVGTESGHQRPRPVRRIRQSAPGERAPVGGENEMPMPSKQLNQALARKADSPISSPVTSHALGLARFWDTAHEARSSLDVGDENASVLAKPVAIRDREEEFPSFQSDI